MVSYISGKENMCSNHPHPQCEKIFQNEPEGSEIEFEGWLQLGNPVRESELDFNGRCNRFCPGRSPNRHASHLDNICCMHQEPNMTSGGGGCRSASSHGCGHNLNAVAPIHRSGRCANCNGRSRGCGGQIRGENEVYYVNNRQNAPTVVVQKPQTVVVRNKSRPPIVVQQPPPNVIVKNDPPQPIYVQSCPPNITVKNSEAARYSNFQAPQANFQFERANYDHPVVRQSTYSMPKGNPNSQFSNRSSHCIYHCKHPCHVNFN